jgi:hypothetical protein
MVTSYAQSTSRCADLARFQMPGATIEITGADGKTWHSIRGGDTGKFER